MRVYTLSLPPMISAELILVRMRLSFGIVRAHLAFRAASRSKSGFSGRGYAPPSLRN